MFWYARGLEVPACPAKLADSGGRRPSKAMAALMSSWRRSSNGSRKTRPRTAAKGSTISASRGQGRGVVEVSALQTWGRTPGPDMSSTTTTPLSQRAKPSPLWSNASPKRRKGGVLVVGATPGFSPLMRHERGQGRTGLRTPCPPRSGVAPTPVIPGGKAEMKTCSQVILVNLAVTAVGLRVWLDPWPALGEVAQFDLVRDTDPVSPFCRRLHCSHRPLLSDCQSGYSLHLEHMIGPRIQLDGPDDLGRAYRPSRPLQRTNLSPLRSVRSSTPTRFGRLAGLNGW